MSSQFNPFSLDGKTVVITGASSGIGRQCAIDCSKMGAKIIMIARNEDRLKECLGRLNGSGHMYFLADLSQTDKVVEVSRKITINVGKIDGIVHCAGISTTLPLKLMTTKLIMDFFRTNVFSAIELTRELSKVKSMNEGGSIVYLSSVMGCVGEKGKSLYSMTKGSLIAGAKSLACEFSKRRIRVNCISPGVIQTPINEKLSHMTENELRKKLEEMHLLGFGKSEDISNGVIYLLSDAARWITGQNIIIDGGYTVR